jgi:hypothetical protein
MIQQTFVFGPFNFKLTRFYYENEENLLFILSYNLIDIISEKWKYATLLLFHFCYVLVSWNIL